MMTNDLVLFEIDQFKRGWGRKLCFDSLTNRESVDGCLAHALSDALNQGVRRHSLEYKTKLNAILGSVRNEMLSIANGSVVIEDKNGYKQRFCSLKDSFLNALNNNGLEALATFGYAQKFISMSFKYLYCFGDCVRANLKFCYIPLDQYTIDWYKEYGLDQCLKDSFGDINFAWSRIGEELYFDIQSDIDDALRNGIDYPINCKDLSRTVKLPENKIEVEFIVWMQQRLNDVYNKHLLKLKAYYDRLGIKEV